MKNTMTTLEGIENKIKRLQNKGLTRKQAIGHLGEKIVKQVLKREGYSVRKNNNQSASRNGERQCFQVKTIYEGAYNIINGSDKDELVNYCKIRGKKPYIAYVDLLLETVRIEPI